MGIRIALAGNPNCGKTTMFNALTGARQYVGNWPGVTVEKKEGKYKADKDVTITDLPGVYSLSPYSPEEIVTRDYLLDGRPDAVINLVDATNLERNLYLTTQILDLGLPVVIAMNMMDLVKKNGDKIDIDKLSRKLGCPIVPTSALKGDGLDQLLETAIANAKGHKVSRMEATFTKDTETAIQDIQQVIASKVSADAARWYAIKLLENEERTVKLLKLDAASTREIDTIRSRYEKLMDDDAESAVTTERYDLIGDIVSETYKRSLKGMTASEKADRIITSRVWGLPIFVAIMFLVYYIAISTVGTAATDWVNDNLFGDGWLITGSEEYNADNDDYTTAQADIKSYLAAAEAAGYDTAGVSEALAAEDPTAEDEAAIDAFVDEMENANVIGVYETIDDETNEVVTNDVDYDTFVADLDVEEPDPADYGVFMPSIPDLATSGLEAIGCADWLESLVVDGVIAGVGSVLGFLPQMAVLFLELAILEGCGYMARIAFLMDRIFRKFGLSGKSFIPMLVASGCGVPAVMSTKTIEDERDRRLTIMTTTMIPCSAKTPIIALIFGAMAGGSSAGTWWVAPLFYFLGVIAIIISGIMLRKTRAFAGEATPFVMELPEYHVPSTRNVLMSTWERCKAFIIKAGTIIFLSAVVIWFLLNFGVYDGSFGLLDTDLDDYMQYSILAMIGNALSWIFLPLGFGGLGDNWQATVTTITGLVAKENVVSTVGIITSVGTDASESDPMLWQQFALMFNGSMPAMAAFCAFNLLCAPCFAAMGAIRNQMANAKWFWAAIGYMCGFAWCVGTMIYQFGSALTGEASIPGLILAFVILAAMLFQLFRPMPHYDDAEKEVPVVAEAAA